MTSNNAGDSEEQINKTYFNSYVDLEVHKLMLQDLPRTLAYKNAILASADAFKNKVVMDIGAGTGILSLFCKEAGAKRVYAVEASKMAEPLKEIIALNNASDVIKVVEGMAEEISLPDDEKVDIIVSEFMGFYLLHESMLQSVIKARDRHLREGGLVFPSHAKILSAVCSLQKQKEESLQFWCNVFGFDMSPLAKLAAASGRPEVIVVDESQLLSEPQLLVTLDLSTVSIGDLEAVQGRHFTSITACPTPDTSLDGLALWFDCDFAPSSVVLSTAPSAAETHWKQTVVVLPSSQQVEEDDVVGWQVSLTRNQDNPRRYDIGVEMLDPAEEEHPVPCSCGMAKCALIKALMSQEDDTLSSGEEQ